MEAKLTALFRNVYTINTLTVFICLSVCTLKLTQTRHYTTNSKMCKKSRTYYSGGIEILILKESPINGRKLAHLWQNPYWARRVLVCSKPGSNEHTGQLPKADLFNSVTDSSAIKGGPKLEDQNSNIDRKVYLLFKVWVNELADVFAFERHTGENVVFLPWRKYNFSFCVCVQMLTLADGSRAGGTLLCGV